MLKNALADYLSNINNEDDIRWLLMTLLPSMGFTHVHYTHGKNEFGRDIVARKIVDDIEVQFVIQVKRGDIDQRTWRNDVMGQLSECLLTSGISHPQFSSALPRQAVLALSGRLNTNAQTSFSGFNNELSIKSLKPVEVWDLDHLVELFARYGLEGFHASTAEGYEQHASFYTLYASALRGNLVHQQIERHSRQWIDEAVPAERRILRAAVESRLLIGACELHGHWYEAIVIRLAAIRAILYPSYDEVPPSALSEYFEQATSELREYCGAWFSAFYQQWQDNGCDFLHTHPQSSAMMTYLVNLSRIIEIAGLLWHLTNDQTAKATIAQFIADFIIKEPSVGKIPSDRYAVSIVMPVLALYKSGQTEPAITLLKRVAIWLCDRREQGHGLAPFEAFPYEETATLLYYAFESVPTMQGWASFLGAAISDLAALINVDTLYADVVNDFKAVHLAFAYWQVKDTKGIFRIEANDIVAYPNIEWQDTLQTHGQLDYSNHLADECHSFALKEYFDENSLHVLTLLLRDRYFPATWY